MKMVSSRPKGLFIALEMYGVLPYIMRTEIAHASHIAS